ncbi:MAG: succinyldiaminopimelate transaminase [Pseudomonadales bacterium]|nr:succinyldiaminopimelate transaminase [Halioglobus sp.]MCP5123833.1 succinyldiaminopimelate transaminase [Pseudomonadales bacterium]
MNPHLQQLHPYPFERLRQLFTDIVPPAGRAPISLSIGEPRHASPAFVLAEIAASLDRLSNYPTTAGIPQLRQAIASWLQRRFELPAVDPDHQVLPVSGTREALFAFAQAVVSPGPDALVMSPNPFYQIYEGAALLAGATPHFINCTQDSGLLPDFASVSEQQWRQCQLLYLCSPGNPTGAVLSLAQLQQLIALAREYDFVIAGDECYSEIYFDEAAPPPGLLQACAAMGDGDYRNCVVFHSLSKRSNLPGMRSGFVAGDADILRAFALYRTYHGCAMPLHHQLGSIAAWNDEAHVIANRQLYRQKFASVLAEFDGKLAVAAPDAGFYLWPRLEASDTQFARRLYASENVIALPGSFLAREVRGVNPGANHLRLALVAEPEQCVEAARRIVRCLATL